MRIPAQDLSEAALGGPIRVQGDRFVDSYGRTLSLRGFNVSGASKLPTEPNGLSHLTDGFYEHRTVTFTGRPCTLEEAPLHFRRLQTWGLPFIRLLVTWESIGHAGPDPSTDIDVEYIAYLRALIQLMPQYGLKCFVCAHQDVWSRFSGGSGAPGWTFEAAGLDIEAFTDTGAAYVHGQDELRRASGLVNANEPSGPFVWPSGYQKLAASTMATLFWAGDALAPKLQCKTPHGEVSIQKLLQDAYIEAFGRLADELSDLEACLGFEPMNEPHRGLVNLHDFHGWNYNTDLHIGYYPTFAQALALGSGYSQKVKYYVKSWPWPTRVSHKTVLDPKGRSAWLAQGLGECVWKAHGVWSWDEKTKTAKILHKDYFDVDHRPGREGQRLEWYRDCYGPFLDKFCKRVARRGSHFLSFFEPIPNEFMPPWQPKDRKPAEYIDIEPLQNMVFAPHFYDLNVLFSKQHTWMSVNVQGLSRGMLVFLALYFGPTGLRKNYRKQLGNVLKHGMASLGRVPTVIGEIGIPFDINDGSAFKTGQYDTQRDLMNALIGGMEDNQVGFTLWNYNPHNRVEYGDGWNKEDFSVVNGDDHGHETLRRDYRNKPHENDDMYRGGRVLDVIIRPYAVKTVGVPLRASWDHRTLRYELEWESEQGTRTEDGRPIETEVFIPAYHYAAHKLVVALNSESWDYDREQQTLRIRHGPGKHHLVVEIEDVQAHLVKRVALRRESGVAPSILDNVPIEVEVWLDGLNWGALMWLLVALLAVAIGFISKMAA
ncbi:glycoside hydrolase superfamily [Stachybotrys elegans]|uniref:Glycoside hydrolase superfamily n=1 Tax=Stachybotrys elegans TaxID=80388 RepID=A0A8K0SY25_9HYPO|nr:glycoside hydrolase superfamily [Stachybotrys elegans]